MLSGENIYTDIPSGYGPFTHFFYLVILKIFGSELIYFRLAGFCIYMLVLTLIFKLIQVLKLKIDSFELAVLLALSSPAIFHWWVKIPPAGVRPWPNDFVLLYLLWVTYIFMSNKEHNILIKLNLCFITLVLPLIRIQTLPISILIIVLFVKNFKFFTRRSLKKITKFDYIFSIINLLLVTIFIIYLLTKIDIKPMLNQTIIYFINNPNKEYVGINLSNFIRFVIVGLLATLITILVFTQLKSFFYILGIFFIFTVFAALSFILTFDTPSFKNPIFLILFLIRNFSTFLAFSLCFIALIHFARSKLIKNGKISPGSEIFLLFGIFQLALIIPHLNYIWYANSFFAFYLCMQSFHLEKLQKLIGGIYGLFWVTCISSLLILATHKYYSYESKNLRHMYSFSNSERTRNDQLIKNISQIDKNVNWGVGCQELLAGITGRYIPIAGDSYGPDIPKKIRFFPSDNNKLIICDKKEAIKFLDKKTIKLEIVRDGKNDIEYVLVESLRN